MPIPALTQRGFLPDGVHDCTLEELQARFGSFSGTERRSRLFDKLQAFVGEVRATGLASSVLVNGSYVTGKRDPNDIDLILVMPADHNFAADLRPAEYNVVSKLRVHRRYGFDLLVAREGAEEYHRYVEFFQQVRLEPGERKGILRVNL